MQKSLKSSWLIVGVVIVVGSLFAIPLSTQFEQNPNNISLGILFDFAITIPAIYLLFIWKRQVPKFSVVYIFLLSIFLAKKALPPNQEILVSKLQYFAIPIIELGILITILYKFQSLRKHFKKYQETDFFNKVTFVCQKVFPKRLANVLATEISVFYYLFKFKSIPDLAPNEFTYYKKSGIKLTLIAFLFLILIESIIVHFLVSNWNQYIAWILTFLSIYALLQVISIMNSMNTRPIIINYKSKRLELKYGFGCQSEIPFDEIEDIKSYSSKDKNMNNHIHLSLFDLLDTNNITITLKSENILYKLYGMEKKYKSISLFTDEKKAFVNTIEIIINEE